MGMLPVLIRCFTFWIGSVLSCLGYQPKPRLAARNIHSILPLPGELPDRSRRKQDLSYHQVQTSPIDLHIRSIVVPDSSSTAVIVHCHRPPADLITSPGFPLHLSQCFLRAARLRNCRLMERDLITEIANCGDTFGSQTCDLNPPSRWSALWMTSSRSNNFVQSF